MRSLLLALSAPLAALILVSPAEAFDTTTQSLVKSGYVTSQVTSAPFDNKVVMAAQDDAAVYVATDGEFRGIRLEAALRNLRQNHAKLDASDLELARAILVQ